MLTIYQRTHMYAVILYCLNSVYNKWLYSHLLVWKYL